MIFIDKIYFRVYKAYKDRFKSDISEFYAVSYVIVMPVLHILFVLKILTLCGIEIDTRKYSKLQKVGAVIGLYAIFGIRYYFFFDPVKFEKKYGFSQNYMPIIIYTLLFLVSFFILVLVF